MLALLTFGRIVEKKIGSNKTAFIYFFALLVSSIGDCLVKLIFDSNIGSLGASGAISGIAVVAILLDPFYLVYEFLIPMPVMFIAWLQIYSDIFGVFYNTDSSIAYFSHVFGYLSIAIYFYFSNFYDCVELKKGFYINIVSLILIGLIYLLFFKKYF